MSERPIAVLHTVGSLIRHSGVTPFIQQSLSFRTQKGWPTSCLYFDAPESLDSQSIPGLHPLQKPSNPWRQFTLFAQSTRQQVQQWQRQGLATVIHDHGLWLPNNLASAYIARQMQCPYVVSPHGMLQPTALEHASLKKRIAWHLYERRRLQSVQRLHATAPVEQAAIEHQLPQARTMLVKLGIDVPGIPPTSHTRRQEVLYLGRMHPLKGIDLLLDAWRLTHAEGWRLRLVGPCETAYREHLERKIHSQGLQGSVRLEGALYGEAKVQALDQAMLLVLPSYSENFGMVVCEALARGLPVITTDNTPWGKLPSHGCGWICPAQADALARTLQQAMAIPPHDLALMGHSGWAWMRESFDLPVVMQDMERHYQELCDA